MHVTTGSNFYKKTAEMLKYAKLKKAEISAFNDNGVLYEDCVFETRAPSSLTA